MGDTVALLNVIHVLQAHRITVTQVTVRANTFTVEGNGVLEEMKLPDRVGRRRLRYLTRKFGVPIHLWWNPEQCPAIESDNVQ